MNTAILIPAYEPDEKLIYLVRMLSDMGSPVIMVVNDGSSERCEAIFDRLLEIPRCTVLHHKINKGKGAALKTGMKSLLAMDADMTGCITVDADGQHIPEDIANTAGVFENNKDALVLGCRDFNAGNTPFKSRFGNLLTRAVYRIVTGRTVSDTQTGLRAVPAVLMKDYKELPGDRYEFEMNMLMHAARNDVPIIETPIRTVYIDRNRSSHFNPLKDSVRIYAEIMKFSFSSLFCSAVDVGLFTLFFRLFSAYGVSWPLLGATGFARLVSSGMNFTINKKIVFRDRDAVMLQIVKYYLLCGIQMLCSWLLLEGFTSLGLKHVVILKILGDTLLFFISYAIQRLFVFGRSMPHEKNA